MISSITHKQSSISQTLSPHSGGVDPLTRKRNILLLIAALFAATCGALVYWEMRYCAAALWACYAIGTYIYSIHTLESDLENSTAHVVKRKMKGYFTKSETNNTNF